MRSDTINWGMAVLLTSLLFISVFVQRGAQMGIENSPIMHSPLITHLTFKQPILNQRAPTPEVAPPVKKKATPLRKPEPVVIKKAQSTKKLEKREPEKQIVQQSEPKPQPQGQITNTSSKIMLQQKRDLYLQKLLSHIESFKFYPRMARRRNIEGNVRISFVLQDSGGYEQLILDGKHNILGNATRIALEAATPLPMPSKNLAMSRQIEFSMAYSIN